MEELFRTIPAIIGDGADSDAVLEALIASAWKKAAGESLWEHTAFAGLEDKTLRIAVRDNIWKRHLESLAGQMIFKINSLLGSALVTYIEFRVDEAAVADRVEEPGDLPDLEFEKIAESERTGPLAEYAGGIADPGLRELFLAAASKCIARKKLMRSVR